MKYRKLAQSTACLHCNGPLPDGRYDRNFCSRSHYTMWLYKNSPKYHYNQLQQFRKRNRRAGSDPLYMINKHMHQLVRLLDNERLGYEENAITNDILTV